MAYSRRRALLTLLPRACKRSPSWVVLLAVALALAGCHRRQKKAIVDAGAVDAAQAAASTDVTRTVVGEVTAAGRPVGFATVRLGTAGHIRQVVADEGGHFELANVVPGAYALAATTKNLGAFNGLDVGIDPAQPLVVEVRLALEPTLPLVGSVRDPDGKPLAGAVVLVEENERPLPVTLETGPDGRFVAEDRLKSATYRLSVRRAGYLPDGPRLVRAGAPVEIRLRQGATLEIVVVDEGGVPVPDTELAVVAGDDPQSEDAMPLPISDPGGGGWAHLQSSGELGVLTGTIPFPPATPMPSTSQAPSKLPRSDAHGRYHVAELPAGQVVVTAHHPDFAGATSVPLVLVAGETRNVRIELEHGARIAGRVLDERGLGIPDAQVTSSDGRTVVSDGGGRFVIEHVAGHFTMSVRRAGYLRGEGTLDLQGQREAAFDITLRRALGHLGGVVTDPEGRGVSDARLEVTPPGSHEPQSTTTDGSGRFLLEGMADGPYRVTIEHGDFARLSLQAVEATLDARLVLHLGGGLDGELFDPRTGTAPVDARLQWSSGDDHRAIPLQGRAFRAVGLPAGPCKLVATARGYPRLERELDLPESDRPGEITARDLRLELELGGHVRGRVRDDRGDPVANAEVKLASAPSAVDPVHTDSEGHFLLDGVPSGTARISVRGTSETVEVRSNEESRVDLVVTSTPR